MRKHQYSVAAMKENRRFGAMHRGAVRGVALALLVTALGGCASYSRDHVIVGSVPDDYRMRHPIIVSEDERNVDIVIATSAMRMSARSLDVVKSFGDNFRKSGARSVRIMIPSGSPNERAARAQANQAVRELTETGVPRSRISISHYDATNHGEAATLRLAYTDLTAAVASQCGQWDEDITDTSENRNYANMGCATQNNLAQMVANPADLLGPRGETEVDSTRRTQTIEDWRTNGHSGDDFILLQQ